MPPRLEVFDPPLCCSTGVCGPGVDPTLVRLAADLEWRRRGTRSSCSTPRGPTTATPRERRGASPSPSGPSCRAGIEPFAWVVNQALTPLDLRDPVLLARRRGEARYLHVVDGLARRTAVLPWSEDADRSGVPGRALETGQDARV